jgi:hypothetical protein
MPRGSRHASRSDARSSVTAERRPAGAAWVLLMPRIPPKPAYVRVKVWRRLQAIGAVAIKNSVWVLPRREECIESFQWVTRELGEMGGGASLCEGQFVDGVTDQEIERLFVEARDADYAALTEEARALAKHLRPKRLDEAALVGLDGQAAKLRQRFDAIVATDFCHAPGREAAEGLVVDLEQKLAAVRSPRGEPRARGPVVKPTRRTWVTRTGVHVDRIASAWLIRRFIDPQATLKFVPAQGYAPESGELRFDMYDAEFTHEGDRCTFEVLLRRMGIEDAALVAIGEIVHDIDLKDDKFGRPETAGFRSILNGLCGIHRDDSERIQHGTTLLEGLYGHFRAARSTT